MTHWMSVVTSAAFSGMKRSCMPWKMRSSTVSMPAERMPVWICSSEAERTSSPNCSGVMSMELMSISSAMTPPNALGRVDLALITELLEVFTEVRLHVPLHRASELGVDGHLREWPQPPHELGEARNVFWRRQIVAVGIEQMGRREGDEP